MYTDCVTITFTYMSLQFWDYIPHLSIRSLSSSDMIYVVLIILFVVDILRSCIDFAYLLLLE